MFLSILASQFAMCSVVVPQDLLCALQSTVCCARYSISSVLLHRLFSVAHSLRRRSAANAFSLFVAILVTCLTKLLQLLQFFVLLSWLLLLSSLTTRPRAQKNSSSRIVPSFWLGKEPIPFSISVWKWTTKKLHFVSPAGNLSCCWSSSFIMR